MSDTCVIVEAVEERWGGRPGSRIGDRKVPEPVLLTRCTAPRPKSHPPTTIKEAGFCGIRTQTSIVRVVELVGAQQGLAPSYPP